MRGLSPEQFIDDTFGILTVRDIFAALEKPGRDPRPGFKTASFADGIEKIGDLRPGMVLEGTVTNVAAFGAFVDIGVHQDGLVHVSQLADKFVKDPHDVVKAGDIVKVRVTEVDPARQRIGLSMRKDGGQDASDRGAQSKPDRTGPKTGPKTAQNGGPKRGPKTPQRMSASPSSASGSGALGDALRNAMKPKPK